MLKSLTRGSAAALVLALGVAACSPDATGPTGTSLLRPSLSTLGGPSTWTGTDGSVEVCKLAPDATAASWADFAVAAGSGELTLGTGFRLEAGSVFPGNCVIVWRPTDLAEGWTASVTASEVGMTPGMQVEVVSVIQPGLARVDYWGGNSATVSVADGLGARIIFKNSGTPDEPPPPPDDPPSGELAGCTPGFWRQAHHYQYWTTYDPGQTWGSVFADPGSTKSGGGKNAVMFTQNTVLGQAVELGGGGILALARHAVAGLLNAASPDVNYGLTTAQVISLVNGAIASGNYNGAKSQLEALNEIGCTAKD